MREDWQKWTKVVRWIILGIALLLLVLFIVLNSLPVEVRLIVTSVQTRLAWALLLAGLLGFIVGYVWPRRRW